MSVRPTHAALVSMLASLTVSACTMLAPSSTPSSSSPSEEPPAVEAVELAPPPRPEFVNPTRKLETEIRALEAAGFTSGPALQRSLDAFEPIPLPTAKDLRYAVILQLEPGSTFSPKIQGYGLLPTIMGGMDACWPGHVDGGAVVTECNGVDFKTISGGRERVLHFVASDGKPLQRDQPEVLGTGPVTAYIYSRPATKEDSARWREQTEAFIHANSPEARGARSCQACRAAYDDCRVTAGNSNCVARYAGCIPEAAQRKQATWELCGHPAP